GCMLSCTRQAWKSKAGVALWCVSSINLYHIYGCSCDSVQRDSLDEKLPESGTDEGVCGRAQGTPQRSWDFAGGTGLPQRGQPHVCRQTGVGAEPADVDGVAQAGWRAGGGTA